MIFLPVFLAFGDLGVGQCLFQGTL